MKLNVLRTSPNLSGYNCHFCVLKQLTNHSLDSGLQFLAGQQGSRLQVISFEAQAHRLTEEWPVHIDRGGVRVTVCWDSPSWWRAYRAKCNTAALLASAATPCAPHITLQHCPLWPSPIHIHVHCTHTHKQTQCVWAASQVHYAPPVTHSLTR